MQAWVKLLSGFLQFKGVLQKTAQNTVTEFYKDIKDCY